MFDKILRSIKFLHFTAKKIAFCALYFARFESIIQQIDLYLFCTNKRQRKLIPDVEFIERKLHGSLESLKLKNVEGISPIIQNTRNSIIFWRYSKCHSVPVIQNVSSQ